MIKPNTQLGIIISGQSGTGKSHFAAHLARLLAVDGFDVKVEFGDMKDSSELGGKDVVKVLKDNVAIQVTEMQLPR